MLCLVVQSCPTLRNPMDCNQPIILSHKSACVIIQVVSPKCFMCALCNLQFVINKITFYFSYCFLYFLSLREVASPEYMTCPEIPFGINSSYFPIDKLRPEIKIDILIAHNTWFHLFFPPPSKKKKKSSSTERHATELCMGFSYTYQISGEGNGTPFQYSCLENPTGRGAW